MFTILFKVGYIYFKRATLDLRVSINVMLQSIYSSLILRLLKNTGVIISNDSDNIVNYNIEDYGNYFSVPGEPKFLYKTWPHEEIEKLCDLIEFTKLLNYLTILLIKSPWERSLLNTLLLGKTRELAV